jgi:hypothetical protein
MRVIGHASQRRERVAYECSRSVSYFWPLASAALSLRQPKNPATARPFAKLAARITVYLDAVDRNVGRPSQLRGRLWLWPYRLDGERHEPQSDPYSSENRQSP